MKDSIRHSDLINVGNSRGEMSLEDIKLMCAPTIPASYRTPTVYTLNVLQLLSFTVTV